MQTPHRKDLNPKPSQCDTTNLFCFQPTPVTCASMTVGLMSSSLHKSQDKLSSDWLDPTRRPSSLWPNKKLMTLCLMWHNNKQIKITTLADESNRNLTQNENEFLPHKTGRAAAQSAQKTKDGLRWPFTSDTGQRHHFPSRWSREASGVQLATNLRVRARKQARCVSDRK